MARTVKPYAQYSDSGEVWIGPIPTSWKLKPCRTAAALIPISVVNVKYLLCLFQAMYQDLRELGRGGQQSALNCEIISSIRIPLPSRSEQDAIIQQIRDKTDKLALTECLVTQQLELLQERRTALISAAVTGKIDVRGWEAKA